MSTATAPATTGAPAGAGVENRDAHRVTFPRAVRSEWIKLVSLRSSWITFAAAVVAIVGLGALISYVTSSHWAHMPPQEQARFQPVARSLGGVDLAQLAVGVLGVLVVTGEYATGMIRSSLMAAPKRLPVLWAKIGVFASVSFVLMLVSTFISFFAVMAIVSRRLRVHGLPGLLGLAPIVETVPGIPGGPALRVAAKALAGAGGALTSATGVLDRLTHR